VPLPPAPGFGGAVARVLRVCLQTQQQMGAAHFVGYNGISSDSAVAMGWVGREQAPQPPRAALIVQTGLQLWSDTAHRHLLVPTGRKQLRELFTSFSVQMRAPLLVYAAAGKAVRVNKICGRTQGQLPQECRASSQ
jgi:hypothetical protein